MFGWSSLEYVFRQEKVFSDSSNDTLLFSAVFTVGTVGVYMSNIVFGTLMDRRGAKLAGSFASLGFGLGLFCCSLAVWNGILLCIGFFLLGICGPAIQLTTIPFSSLFDGYHGVTIRSLQAATFDGSSVIFYMAKLLYEAYHVSSQMFFICALSIPVYTFMCEIMMWPSMSLEQYEDDINVSCSSTSGHSVGADIVCDNIASDTIKSSYDSEGSSIEMEAVGYDISAPIELSLLAQQVDSSTPPSRDEDYYNDVKTLVHQRDFVYLIYFTSIHILKLIFFIVSINAQLKYQYDGSAQSYLLFYFGLILPFGFLFMPVSTWLLNDHREGAFHVANVFGLIYGSTLLCNAPLLQIVVTFPLVSVSRQLVFSTVFQEVASCYGFQYFGTLMGLINIVAAIVGSAQFALVAIAESQDSYVIVNILLIVAGLPLLFRRMFLSSECVRKLPSD